MKEFQTSRMAKGSQLDAKQSSAKAAIRRERSRLIKIGYHARVLLFPAKRRRLPLDYTGQRAADRIAELLTSPAPCMIGRWGGTELAGLLSVWDLRDPRPVWAKRWKVFTGEMRAARGWNPRIRRHLAEWSGFFPLTDEALARFAERLERDAGELDLVGSWNAEETRVRHLHPRAEIVSLPDLRPERHDPPWSRVLAGRRVLVVHPFEASIRSQYARRERLFPDREVLPAFELRTLKAVQSLGGVSDRFATWFDALEWMCGEIDRQAYDVAIIGAGAYGMPLAAHVKRSGRTAIHLGGATQLMFGIMGNRWQRDPDIAPLVNEYWVRPLPSETPAVAGRVESACYW